MKAVLLAFFAALAAVVTLPAAAEAPAVERARIAAERGKVEARYLDEERVCWGRFAVNGCLAAARAKRRSALADLRRQEISLNDAERKQRAAERLRSMEQRAGTAPPPAAPPKIRDRGDRGDRGDRDAKAAQRAAEQAAREAERASRTSEKRQADSRARLNEELARREAERASRAERAAENVRRREARQREAMERQEALQRRLAARHKPPAAPLPVPP